MTDWHCHLLPGMDDGAETVDEALDMADALARNGFTRICCTPHGVRGMYDNTPGKVRGATGTLQRRVDAAGIPLALVPGMEYYLDEHLLDLVGDPLLLPGNMLLVEIPGHADPEFAAGILHKLILKKITPLIAHPERCPLYNKMEGHESQSESLLQKIRGVGCAFQGNLGSFFGLYGERVKEKARAFLNAGVYTRFGTDMHSKDQSGILIHARHIFTS